MAKRKQQARKGNGQNLEPVSTTVPPETRLKLVEIALAEHRNLSQVVRIAIDEYLQRRNAA